MSARGASTLQQLAERADAAGRGVDHGERDETVAALRALERVSSAGLTPWCVPHAFGGADTGGLAPDDTVSVRALCALRRALAYHSGLADVMLVMQGLGSYALARGAGAELQRTVLPAVARGARIAAFALTEPGAGSSLGDVATRATRLESGRGWRLDGQKAFISNAGLAHFYTLLARTSGEPGRGEGALSMFHVPADAPGLSALRFEVMAPHPIGDLVLKGVELPAGHLLGAEGGGLALALEVLSRFRTSVAAAAIGFGRRALDESRRHLRTRRQFGKPLAAFQALAFDVAEMDTRLRAAELLVDEAAAAVDRGEPSTAPVARAKLFATEVASWVCDRAVQHLGGRGVKRGETVERLYREVRALRIYEGTSEIQRLILSKELLEG
jgi:acyl-CoA dehydrogenase